MSSIEVKIGQVYRDRDKRMSSGNRHCKVTAIQGQKALMDRCRPDGTLLWNEGSLQTKIGLARLQRQVGWLLVHDV